MADNNQMREVSTMTVADWQSAKPGERFVAHVKQAPEFSAHYADDVLLSGAMFEQIELVFTRTEADNFVRTMELEVVAEAGSALLKMSGVESAQSQVAVTRCRMPVQAAMNAGLAILRQVIAVSPGLAPVVAAEVEAFRIDNAQR